MISQVAATPTALFSAGSYTCRGFGEAIAGRRASREAAMLIAAADAELERTGVFQDVSECRLRADALDRILGVIGQEELDDALTAGAALPLAEAIKVALSVCSSSSDE
jgi:hypothetical protein